MLLNFGQAPIRRLIFVLSMCSVSLVVLANQPSIRSQTPSKASPAEADWDRYTERDADFSVLLPTVPAMSTYDMLYSEPGKNPSKLKHLLGVYFQGVVYAIYVFERKQSLDGFIADFGHSSTGNFKRELNIAGVLGKEYTFQNDDRRGVTQFFITGRRIYVFVGHGSTLGNPDIGIPTFLESIRFGKNLDGRVIIDGPGDQLGVTTNMAGENAAAVFSGKLVDRKAVIITKPAPGYTQVARQNQIMGTVVLRCVFSSYGAVTNIHMVSGLPDGLTEGAIVAARKIKFIPAIKDGHFVSMFFQLEYNFNLY